MAKKVDKPAWWEQELPKAIEWIHSQQYQEWKEKNVIRSDNWLEYKNGDYRTFDKHIELANLWHYLFYDHEEWEEFGSHYRQILSHYSKGKCSLYMRNKIKAVLSEKPRTNTAFIPDKWQECNELFKQLAKKGYCKQNGKVYSWQKSKALFVYMIATLSDSYGLKVNDRYDWETARMIFTMPKHNYSDDFYKRTFTEDDGTYTWSTRPKGAGALDEILIAFT